MPKCDFCNQEAIYDAPTKIGPWAYFCAKCYQKEANKNFPATTLKPAPKQEQPEQPKKPVPAICLTTVADACFDSVIEWECPHCGYVMEMEVDAGGQVKCHDCGNPLILTPFI